MTPRLRFALAAIIMAGSMFWAGWLGLRQIDGRSSLIDRVETVLLDLRIRLLGQRVEPADIFIVAIDDATTDAAGRYPLARSSLADIVSGVRRAGAKAIAIDMLLAGRSNSGDEELAAALKNAPVVIGAAARFPEKAATGKGLPAPDEVLPPLPEFSSAARVGLVNLVTDNGGTPRALPMVFNVDGAPQMQIVLQAVSLYLGQTPSLTATGINIAGRDQPLDLGWHLPLNYYGAGGTIKTLSASRFLGGNDAGIDLSGKLVFIGATVTGAGDRFATPFDFIMPGVEVLATGAANLLEGSALIHDETVRKTDAGVAIGLTIIGLLLVTLLPLATASIAYVVLILGWIIVTLVAFSQGYWLSGALPVAASLPPVFLFVVLRQALERYELGKLNAARLALSQFQAPAIAKRIADDPLFLAQPRHQTVATLFLDLGGYTSLSENMGPAKTREFLKAFHTLVVNESNQHEGVVMDFMGDGVMISFGVPDPGGQDARHAFDAAFSLVRAVSTWSLQMGIKGDETAVRVGGHCGEVVLSRLGHENQQQVAVTGDSVNVASRLLEVAKAQGVAIALSTELTSAAHGAEGSNHPAPRRESVSIRGRKDQIDVDLWTLKQGLNS